VTAGSQIAVSGSTVSFNPFDFTSRWGYDDFCGNNATTASGGTGSFQSRMVYGNVSGGTISDSVVPCGILLTTTSSSGNNETISLYGGNLTLIASSQIYTFEVVFETSNATNATFSFAAGSDNNVIRGGSNGVAIQAIAAGSNVTLETCSGFSCTSTSSGVAYAANTVYKAVLSTNGSGQVCIQVNAGSQVCTSTNVPSSLSADTGIAIGVKTAAASSVTATLLGWAYRIPGF